MFLQYDIRYLPDSRPRIHGGSFTQGSAGAPGLDGSKLAAATNSIVAVIQYRLGVVSFYAVSGAFFDTEKRCSWASTHQVVR